MVEQDFKPDVVVFISKGAFIIGETISNYYDVPLVEIFAVREGNKLKDLLSPIFRFIPKGLKNFLRKKELQSGYHKKNVNRKVSLENGFDLLNKAKNILIVDDSVDTGYTAKQVSNYIYTTFKTSPTFASLNYFSESKEVYRVDYYNYENYVMNGPWSKDSKHYKEFLKRYVQWKEN
ncbi:phosphoribosyltransferase [Rossellomorea sp. AcN35-11]|nr:phosphoribosyltransferase [Rossellomorea aquimaris]WJV30819.1 phosphoribosyltransferase [Rossellomorea sp. AcN35-11]